MASKHGASALGLVSAMPSGPGVIAEPLIHEISRIVAPGVSSWMLTALSDPDALIQQHRRCRTSTLQLVDAQKPATYGQLRAALPGIKLVQVIHVRDHAALEEAKTTAPHVDAILLDSGNPQPTAGQQRTLGGTGDVHDWAVSRRIRDAIGIPLWLAGGLTEHNVAEAVRRVRPFGVDLCSSVRTLRVPGDRDSSVLDEQKLARFFAALQALPQYDEGSA